MGRAVRPRARLRRVQDAPEGVQGRAGEEDRPSFKARPSPDLDLAFTESLLVRPPDRELGGVGQRVV